MNVIAKSSFSIPKENGTDSSFTEGRSYRCVIRSNGDYVVMDNEGSAVQLEEWHIKKLFEIKEEN